MARSQSGAGPAYAAAAVFLMLFVIALLLAIIFWTQRNTQIKLADEAQGELERFIRPEERQREVVSEALNDPDQSVVGAILSRAQSLKRWIVGSGDAGQEEILAELRTLELTEEGKVTEPLVNVVRTLRAENDHLERENKRLVKERKAAREARDAAKERRRALKQEVEKTVSELKSRLEKVKEQNDAYREKVQSRMAKFEQRIEELQSEKRQELNSLRSKLNQKDEQIATLKDKISELTSGRGGGSRVAPMDPTSPDGEVVAILSEDNQVYINRGRQDHVLLGMTFEVFGSGGSIELSGTEDNPNLRGKATVEVISVSARSAVARIVRQERGATVNEGDQIVNLIYDPDTRFRFFVHGLFDIDQTGEGTARGRRRIESMVRNWNGQLSEKLDYRVDFVVLGQQPEVPRKPSEDAIENNPAQYQRYLEAKRRFEKHQEILAKARELAIPVINQNRFLALVGYYER